MSSAMSPEALELERSILRDGEELADELSKAVRMIDNSASAQARVDSLLYAEQIMDEIDMADRMLESVRKPGWTLKA